MIITLETKRAMERYFLDYIADYEPYNSTSMIQKWNYPAGCILEGAKELYRVTGDPGYLKAQKMFVETYLDSDGVICGYAPEERNVDLMASARFFFYLLDQTGEERYHAGIQRIWDDLMQQPRCKCGNFWHKQIYPNQVWLDGLYMVQPFMALYVSRFGKEYGFSDLLSQFENVRRFLYDDAKHLYRHGYDESREVFWADPVTGQSKGFWLRSMGWYAMALVDCYEAMQCAEEEKILLKNLLQEMMQGLCPYAAPQSGLFWQVVDQADLEGNYLETSGNAMLAYALLKGYRLGMLKKENFLQMGLHMVKSLAEMMLVEDADGWHLIATCASAGLGPWDNPLRDGTPEYYVSEPVKSDNAHGVAAMMMAWAEYLKVAG